jgi:adenosylcobinamide-phosphate synthase
MIYFGSAALVLLIEKYVGYPPPVFKSIGHPVQWIGKLLAYLDEGLNDPDVPPEQNRRHGILVVILLCASVGIPTWILEKTLSQFSFGWGVNILLATSLIAQKSLRDHVSAVGKALSTSLFAGRKEVAKIVGRDPEVLDENGVAKAALESLAENTADGIVAPIFWFALFGLPGAAIYKAINTADSMIGHKSEKYLHFGWAAARLDDLVNLPASRLTGLLFAVAAFKDWQKVLTTMWHDAGKHQSPNAGWPESAMAASLGVRFGGPRKYDGEEIQLAYMGDGRAVEPQDIARGLKIFDDAMNILLIGFALLALPLLG